MDRISGLSDELLVKILSFVPTKLAVSTSILSKRWEYLWMWLPTLEFGHSSYFFESKRLRYFLTKNLPLHRAPVIESFSLDLTKSYSKPKEIRMWVVIAISHCVRELEIAYSSKYKPNILPSNLYTCKSLVFLKLDGEILLDVPRMVFLPSLKSLELLHSVKYSNEESLQRLLSNCPILEDLSVDLREKDITGKLTIAVPSLLSLSLYIPYSHDINGFVIDTPSLEYLKLKDHNVKNHYCLIENMPNLMEAYVDVELPDIKSLIGSITSVGRLTICSEVIYEEEGFVFNQLEHLELCTCKEQSSDLLVRLLKDSSNLQGLGLSIIDFHEPKGSVFWIQPSTVPECLLSSLQTLNWSDYTGEPEEADVAVYILQTALHLKTARIKSLESDVPKLEMIKELALASRASTTCQLIFD